MRYFSPLLAHLGRRSPLRLLPILTGGILLFLAVAPAARAGRDGDSPGPDAQKDLTELSLEQLRLLKVTSASLHDQSIKDAPASVTIITADDIRDFGYRTLAEALAYVPGFYTTWDGSYTYLGVRGFSLPGDFNTRTLVLINGHKMTENIFDMNLWSGQDFPLDMSLVARIEVVRGPSSALYGSNGVFATINVITKRFEDSDRFSTQIEAGSLGEKKVQLSGSIGLPRQAHLLLSTSAFNNGGPDVIYFPAFDTSQTNYGRALHMEGEKGFHVFGDLTWKNWELLFVQGDRVQIQPISWGATVFNDRGTRVEDSLGFVDLSYTRRFDENEILGWRTYYGFYRYRGIYHRATDDGAVEDNRECDYGDWVGSELSYRFPAFGPGALTIGAEAKLDLRTMQNVFDVQPVSRQLLNVNQRDKYGGIFLQQEWAIGSRWRLDVGGRLDASWYRRLFVSPRAALIYQPSARDTFKVLFGRAFRNPSAYEMFFQDDGLSAIANPTLRPEKTNTYELVQERQWNRNWATSLSLYRYDLSDGISGSQTPGGLWQYVNDSRIRASGIEAQVTGHLFSKVDLFASLAVQRAVALDGTPLPNSPGQLGKLRLNVPVFGRRFNLSSGLLYVGRRQTDDGASVAGSVVPDLTLSSSRLFRSLSFTAGVKNFLNHPYRDPIALVHAVDTFPRQGRTYFISVQWHGID